MVSNIRPIVWISLYIALVPIFALIYWWLPDSQFRIPDGAGTDYGSWLYYSIVTITTLGFGDYTPACGWAQAVTAVEVMCGLVFLGFFLNAVGSMKSEIDVESEIEKQRLLHENLEKEKLSKNAHIILHKLNLFLSYCYAMTTPASKRTDNENDFNENFKFSDMQQLYLPSGLPGDFSGQPVLESFIKCSANVSLYLDSLQSHIDLSIWPNLLDDCFSFVANWQLFSSVDTLAIPHSHSENALDKAQRDKIQKIIADQATVPPATPGSEMIPYVELYNFIKQNGKLAKKIETVITSIATSKEKN